MMPFMGLALGGAAAVTASTQANNALTAAPKIWSGTQAQYDAITTKDANTIYLIQE